MIADKWMRQGHRWLSIIFVLTALAATGAAASGQSTDSVLFYLPLAPLFLLMASGLYLFVLPYAVRWRGRTRHIGKA